MAGNFNNKRIRGRQRTSAQTELLSRRPVKPKINGFQRFMRRLVFGTRRIFSSLQNNTKAFTFLPFALIGILLISLIAFTFWFFTNKNAYTVFVDEAKVGVIAMSKTLTDEILLNNAISKISADVGMEIKVEEKVAIKPVHASKKDMQTTDYIVSEICQKLTYTVKAMAIRVDGTLMAIVKNKAEADEILEKLKEPYIKEGQDLVEKDFLEDEKCEPIFVNISEIMKPEQAYEALNIFRDVSETYEVKSGDTLSKICQKVKMTLEQIVEANPGLTPTTRLRIGQKLNVIVKTPLLSVRTVEKKVTTEIIPRETRTLEDPERYRTYREVMEQGKDGLSETTEHIIMINGEIVETKHIDTVTTAEPEPQVIKVGTKG